MKKLKLQNFIPLIIAMPSVMIGAIAMHLNKVPITIWGKNVACLFISGLISYFVLSNEQKNRRSKFVAFIVSIIFLILTFFDSGMEGIHRWISIGPLRFYISSIILPFIIIELWRLLQVLDWWFSAILTVGISLLLVFQPDASQATAFIIPMIIILGYKAKNNIHRFGITVLLLAFVISTWIFLDKLPPVVYVEEILNLVANMGLVWFILGVISLSILPLPFILFPPKDSNIMSIGIGIYYIIVLVSTKFGNFPVSLMGYGISPIIGYFIAISWFVKSKAKLDNNL